MGTMLVVPHIPFWKSLSSMWVLRSSIQMPRETNPMSSRRLTLLPILCFSVFCTIHSAACRSWIETIAREAFLRLEVLGNITDVPGSLTRVFLSQAHIEAAEKIREWMSEAGICRIHKIDQCVVGGTIDFGVQGCRCGSMLWEMFMGELRARMLGMVM